MKKKKKITDRMILSNNLHVLCAFFRFLMVNDHRAYRFYVPCLPTPSKERNIFAGCAACGQNFRYFKFRLSCGSVDLLWRMPIPSPCISFSTISFYLSCIFFFDTLYSIQPTFFSRLIFYSFFADFFF